MKLKILNRLVLPGLLLGWLALPQSGLANGACTCARFHDWKDLGCHMSPGSAGAPGSGANQAGGNQANCPNCPSPDGIPRWRIAEPYENLFITDEPLSYTLSSGQRMVFRWHYKQRYDLPKPDECPNLYVVPGSSGYLRRADSDYYLVAARTYGMTNAAWSHNWMMDIVFWDPAWEALPTSSVDVFSWSYEALVFRPEGGINYFYNTNSQPVLSDPVSQVKLQPLSGLGYPTVGVVLSADANNIFWGDPGMGFALVYPDGSQDVFGLAYYFFGQPSPPRPYGHRQLDTSARAFLTQRIDPQGRVTLLGYTNVHFQSFSYFRVQYVVDPDGRTNTFQYDDSGPNPLAVTEIDDPYGRRAVFGYSSNGFTNGLLTSITDAATNTTTFAYQGTSGWITNLTTPYGTTAFTHYQLPDPDPTVTDGFQRRATYVLEPDGARQLFCYIHNTNLVAGTATAPNVPGQIFDDGNSGGAHAALTYRNTFHWDRRQFAALSSGVLNLFTNTWPPFSLEGVLNALSADDLRKADLKHWRLGSDGVSITESLSSERDPSPDGAGQVEGARIWYNYATNQDNYLTPQVEGGPQVTCVARVLPDSNSQYALYGYYTNSAALWRGLVSSSRQSYSLPSGTTAELTNRFQYATNGIDLLGVTNSLGQYVNLGYNANHQITLITNALGQVTRAAYDGATGNLTNLSLPCGLTASLSYYGSNALDPNGALLHTLAWSPIGRSLTFTWTSGLPYTVQDDLGLHLTNFWDGLNRLTGTAFPDGTTTSNVYDRLYVGAAKDRRGYWTNYGYDDLEHLISITDARTNVTTLGWCDCGALSSITDPLTNSTLLNYNNQGLLTNIVFADASSVTYSLDLIGRVTGVADGLGKAVTFGYNNQGLVTGVSNANGCLESVVYDAANRPIQVTDANNITVTNQFDLLNRLTARFWPASIPEGFGWSTNGLVAYTNRNQKVTWFARDGAGRLTAVTNANQEVTQLGYNSLGQVTSLLDGRTSQTLWNYNQYGWLVSKTNAIGQQVVRYTRDPNGQVTNRWTPQFGNTSYSRDALGNVLAVSYPQSSISYTYDALNRLQKMVDDSGTNTFGYTAAGQLLSADGPWASDTATYSYGQQLRETLTLAQPSGGNWQQTYGYDSAWRLQSLSSPAGSFGYGFGGANPASPLVLSLTLPNAASITNHYDSLARLDYTALVNHWGHTLDGYGYSHDPLGLRTNITRNLGLTNNSVTVGYDSIGQLISWQAREDSSGPLRLHEQLGWVFDAAGNLHYRTNGGLIQTFTADPASQLTNVARNSTMTLSGATPAPASVTVNGQPAQTYGDFTFARTNVSLTNGYNTYTIAAQSLTGTNTTNNLTLNLPSSVTLLYDSNGNLTNDGTRSFAYSAENQLTNITFDSTWKTEFVYDGLGRRRIERDYGWQSGQWVKTNETRYVYDGYLAIQERDSNNVARVTYTRGCDLSASLAGAGGIGGLLARTDANGSTFYHADGAGNITALIDGQQNIAGRYTYGPFGRLTGKWGSLADANAMQFSSMPKVGQSGVVGYPSRFYDPTLQRWLNPDPMGELGGINRYPFNFNNPLSFIDPDGMAPQMVTVTADLNGRPTGAGYVDYHQGQNYGIGLHGPLDLGDSPPGRLLDLLGRIQKPIDDAEQRLKDSGNPWTRMLGGLLAGVQWVFPEGKAGKARKACRLERYGSAAEAEASAAANKLLPRPGHERQPKWVGLEGTVDPRTLGKPKNYTDKMNIQMKQDVGDWLRQNAIPKDNEPGRFGIPADKLDEFNQMIENITPSKR